MLCLPSSPPADIIADADQENGDRKSTSSGGVSQQIRVCEKRADSVSGVSGKPTRIHINGFVVH